METMHAPQTKSITVERCIKRVSGEEETFIDYCDGDGTLQKTVQIKDGKSTVVFQRNTTLIERLTKFLRR